MSISTVPIIMGRIESATEDSPIAVFRPKPGADCPSGIGGKLDAVFASTVKSVSLIRSSNRLVGVFHNAMDASKVKARLVRAAQQGE